MKNSQRQNRTRFKLKKVTSRKRLSVFKSNNHLYAQIINDEEGITLASASSLEKDFKASSDSRKELAEKIELAELAELVELAELAEKIKLAELAEKIKLAELKEKIKVT